MSDKKEYLLQIEEDGATNGWVAPMRTSVLSAIAIIFNLLVLQSLSMIL